MTITTDTAPSQSTTNVEAIPEIEPEVSGNESELIWSSADTSAEGSNLTSALRAAFERASHE